MKKCSLPNCNNPHHAKGLCNMHRSRLRRTGKIGTAEKRIPKHRCYDKDGYVRIFVDNKWVREHRYKIEQLIERKLTKKDIIQFKDGNSYNTDIDNLLLLDSKEWGKKFRGENNHQWLGIADITMLVRSWSNDNWRPQVFSRDKWTCQECGKKGGDLNAHHIKELSKIIKEQKELWQKPLDTPEERLEFISFLQDHHEVNDISNGITLCKNCHKKKHAKYP